MSVMTEDPLIPALEAFQRGEYPHDPLIDRLKILSAKIERAKRYRELRTKHRDKPWWTAKMCWEEACRVYEWEWDDISDGVQNLDGMEAKFTQDGFAIRVRMIADVDRSRCGEFTDTCDLPDKQLRLIYRCEPDDRPRDHYQFYIHESGCTLEDLRRPELGRHESWVRARRWMLEETANYTGDLYQEWGCVVTVYKNGVELTETSCWGIEFENDTPWAPAWQREAETYAKGDFVPEAIDDAHRKLKELTA